MPDIGHIQAESERMRVQVRRQRCEIRHAARTRAGGGDYAREVSNHDEIGWTRRIDLGPLVSEGGTYITFD
jgi:hypothetical protein